MNVRAALCAFVRAPLPLRPGPLLAARLSATASATPSAPVPPPSAPTPARVVPRVPPSADAYSDPRLSAPPPDPPASSSSLSAPAPSAVLAPAEPSVAEAPRAGAAAHAGVLAGATGGAAAAAAAAEPPAVDGAHACSDTSSRADGAPRPAGGLRWRCGAVCIPHPEKADKGGEDAYFVVANALGVFDGVGGWASIGVDPGLYSKQLARLTAAHLRSNASDGVRTALDVASRHNSAIGSSTACVLALRDRSLSSLNLGDSGFVVVRDGRLVARTSEQQHYFNCPFQLGTDSMDTVEMGAALDVPLEHGDWLIVATDGLWDNIFDTEVLKIVNEHHTAALSFERSYSLFSENAGKSDSEPDPMDVDERPNRDADPMDVVSLSAYAHADPQVLAQRLADVAQKVATDERVMSPFAMNAQQAGHLFLGGKMDDITVVVALVVDPAVDGVHAPHQELSNTSLKAVDAAPNAGASARP